MRHVYILRAFALLSFSVAFNPWALAAVSVSPGGQASYSMAIAVPPGIAGMSPNLAFSYADGGINGPLGVGWSVQGISSISRCPSTKPVDGVSRAVFFDTADKLCLDGQRLIQTNSAGASLASQLNDAAGLTGTAVREFRTEKDSFARIRAYGAIDNDTSKGPAYFKVWTKSGQIYHYGQQGSDAQALVLADPTGNGTPKVGAVWAVERISDTLGNAIEFKYEQQDDVAWGSGPSSGVRLGREWNIKEILYTRTASQVPANKVVFEYTNRETSAAPGFDRAEAYQRASKNVNIRRLSAIKSYVNATGTLVPVRMHKLTYERSTVTGRSRLVSIKECAGNTETQCLPATAFSYTDGGSPDFTRSTSFAADALATLKMLDASEGKYGAFTGDFNGDGRTDIINWSNNTGLNALYFSDGDGTFTKQTNFNITGDYLFKNDGCYYAIAADFNGDGRSDILRVVKPTCSTSIPSKVFISSGSGTFTAFNLPASIDLQQTLSNLNTTSGVACEQPQRVPGPVSAMSTTAPETDPPAPLDEQRELARESRLANAGGRLASISGTCTAYNRSIGKSYYLIDANGDGFLDILTARLPGYYWNSGWGPLPSEAGACGGWIGNVIGDCNITLHTGDGDGTFTQAYSYGSSASMYAHPGDPQDQSNPYWRRANQADINGDGLQDILSSYAGAWRSNGDGSFTSGAGITDGTGQCPLPIDFNGDQRADCLRTSKTASSQGITLNYASTGSADIAQFNLKTAGDELYGTDTSNRQTIGNVVEDFDGDGRDDILRWGQTNTSDTGIYFSKGDGSFRARAASGLSGIPRPLQGIDRKTAFTLGDFLGNGTVQILHLKHAPSNTNPAEHYANQLYVRSGGGLPTDLLAEVTSPTGLKSTVGTRVPLPNAGSTYIAETSTPAAENPQGNIVDIRPPMYVIPSLTQDTGAGSLTTTYVYKGLKAQRNGRGLLGFRETRQQSPAPNGDAQTVSTRYLLQHPYIGVAALTETYAGGTSLSGQRLSRTAYAYCDKTNDATLPAISNAAAPPAPCAVTAKIARPYLYQSIEQGWDLDNNALPQVKTTNSYNAALDPLTITVQTTGSTLGLSQTFTKTTTNTYFADQTSGDLWILGRLQRSTVRSQVPNHLGSIATSAGTGPNASDQNGGGAPPTPAPLPPEVMSVILQLLLDD